MARPWSVMLMVLLMSMLLWVDVCVVVAQESASEVGSADGGGHVVVGHVLDAHSVPVSGALVVVCDGATGMPLGEGVRSAVHSS